MYSQNKDILLTNNILQIREIIFCPTGGGELTLPNNNKTFTRGNNFKTSCHQSPSVQKRQGERQESSSVSSQVMQFSKNFDTYLRPYLEYKVKNFRGGQISTHLTQWEALTSDKTILQTVVGDTIEFIEQPPEISIIPKNSIAKEHAEQVDTELNNLIGKKELYLVIMSQGNSSPQFSQCQKRIIKFALS